MQRRNFLGLTAGVVGAAAVGSLYYRGHRSNGISASATPIQADSRHANFDTTLDVTSTSMNLGGRTASVFTYNNLLPGPPISVNAGDSVRIRLNNHLPEPTNLHFHGLHIPPGGRADNIFLEVPQGESAIYEFVVPVNHPSGTFWYHPHLHGLAAKQVSMGLAAPFIVRGELDQIPEVAAAAEHILMLQDFPAASHGMMSSGMGHGHSDSPTLVSGQLNPIHGIAQNGLVRLRFLNASISRYYRLKIEEHPMYLIASDGGGIPAPLAMDDLLLMPGQRAEVLIRGERSEGSYQLLSSTSTRPIAQNNEMNDGNSKSIATIVYGEKSERSWNIPGRLVEVPLLTPPSRPIRSFVLAGSDMMAGGGGMMGGGMMGGGAMGRGMMGGGFSIDGRRFDAARIDTSVNLDTVEDWEYVNTSSMDHPMHLHTNPFQMLDSDGRPDPAWHDMVNVPARERVRIRVAFKDFVGTTVQHCHILTHEDAGMMATVQMVAGNSA